MTTSQADRQRVIKFRAISYDSGQVWCYGFYTMENGVGYIRNEHGFVIRVNQNTVGQFTGLLDSSNKEVYEGDIRRETIEHNEADETYYCVMVYIKEWSMFAWLNHTDGEYQKYLDEGAESLDTVMYWCYPAGQEKQEHVTVCGNIYQNSNLLQG